MYEEIKPYDDAQLVDALHRIAEHKYLDNIAAFLLPGADVDELSTLLKTITSVDEFQRKVMSKAVDGVVDTTTTGLTYSGLEYFRPGADGKVPNYLLLSNHRDIVLDPAFVQIILFHNGLPQTEIAVGDNLVNDPFVEDLIRSNRMIKVSRGISAMELYKSSVQLSGYIRERIADGERSIWIAHRQGRAKDGNDTSEHGLLKMLDLSGKGDFVENYAQLRIMPVSVSYEYEPCDLLKCIELFRKNRDGFYKKGPEEDLDSIIAGLVQPKGRVHVTFNRPIDRSELEPIAGLERNQRYQALGEIVDQRIQTGYVLSANNNAAYDVLHGTHRASDEQRARFRKYLSGPLSKVPGDCKVSEIKKLMLNLYSNPVENFLKTQ